MKAQPPPHQPMFRLFAGFGLSVLVGSAASLVVFLAEGPEPARQFLRAFTTDFRVLVSLGLGLGTALIVHKFQHLVAETIESAFSPAELETTEYGLEKSRFLSYRRGVTFAGELIAISFPIFYYSRFPLSGVGTDAMIAIACLQYAVGSYIGRKLRYAGMMLHALREIRITRNLFKERELDSINSYVNVASSLTVVFVYAHVLGYYTGPFRFDSFLGDSVRPLLLLPAVIATPVLLIFNFYPRSVLRRVYDRSIGVAMTELRETLRREQLSAFEKRTHLMEFDKMCRDELRHSLQLRLSDIPIAVTVVAGLVQMLVRG